MRFVILLLLCSAAFGQAAPVAVAVSGSASSSGYQAWPNSGIFLPGQTGDTVRYNVNGDAAWDAANLGRSISINWDGFTAILTGSNLGVTNYNNAGTTTNLNPTATSGPAQTLISPAPASLNTQVGNYTGTAANNGIHSFGSWYRWSMKFAAGCTTHCRFWLGMGVYLNGGAGTEGQTMLGTAKWATDTPNSSLIGFRYSNGTDTTWQAVGLTTGGSQTTTDTTIAIDTNPHLFEITYDCTTARYYIDNVLKASLTTNLPACTAINAAPFWSGDNKNNANTVSGTMYWHTLSLK
jgi:hypothetical protein